MATDVPEGDPIPVEALTASKRDVKVKKAGRGVEITDESVLSAFGDTINEAGRQLVKAVADKVDYDIIATLETIKPEMTFTGTGIISFANVNNALVKFGEDIDEPKVLFIAPQQRADVMNSEQFINVTEIGAEKLLSGVIGEIAGCQVIISNRIKAQGGKYHNFIVKEEAYGILLKRDTEAESDRDIIHKTTVVTIDKHYTTYIVDESKAIKLIVDSEKPTP